MMISTKGRYALRIMVDLAEHEDDRFIPLKDMATRQGISEKYLEGILPKLVRAGFLTALRGKGGGYKLSRPAQDYSVLSILELAEGNLAPVACLAVTPNPCEQAGKCKTLPMWEGLYANIKDYFGGITLADLAQGRVAMP